LLHDIGKPDTRRHEADGGVSFHHHEVVGAKMTRRRMRALKYSRQMIDDVSSLVYLHLRFHGYGDGKWTDSAVRRYVTDAGALLPRLHKLVRADCTTRNKRRAARLQANWPHRRIWRGCGRTWTVTRSWHCWVSRPAPTSVGPGITSRSCGWTAGR
jgi:poly(A) polymerase